ncbi:alpha/beta fold hydrolase [Kitasatospora viridis]|uniref:Pimeloyl-ACP methyl ester carboxylesterase n=1 Tax=Kitasatospora viridis TaxID=281105 RepID=A0A561UEW0_9ACTN|nr:alpha/beta hydrolase [Kitasatospora viridis]TWF97878.1 pimeloyl-ACP methyl ester carboxylesterase [Kitasatospora viridis]
MTLPTAPAAHENGTGIPLVLLHAYPLSARMWTTQLERLPGPAGDRARVIAPDQRGFGTAELGTEAPSLDLVADDLARLLDALGIDRAVVGGLSMGGYATMAFARRHPDRLRGLLLADTKATLDDEPARANRERIAAAVQARGSVQLLVDERIEDGLLGPAAAPALVAQVRSMIAKAAPGAVAWAQRAMAARQESLEVLAGLRVPAAVVVGEHDVLAPVAQAQLMADLLPDAELTVIPSVGHLSSLEAPETFDAAVRALLRRVGP